MILCNSCDIFAHGAGGGVGGERDTGPQPSSSQAQAQQGVAWGVLFSPSERELSHPFKSHVRTAMYNTYGLSYF